MFPTITYFFSFVKIFLTKFQVSKFQKLRFALIGSPWDNFRQSRLCIKAVPLPSLPDIPASYSPENRRRSYLCTVDGCDQLIVGRNVRPKITGMKKRRRRDPYMNFSGSCLLQHMDQIGNGGSSYYGIIYQNDPFPFYC